VNPARWAASQFPRFHQVSRQDRNGALVDTMLSEHRDMAAARTFFRSAKSATGLTPDHVTTDGHGSYPRAIRTTLGRHVEHRTSAYKNNRLEQDHRGVRGRIHGVSCWVNTR
jgi:putative transposase